MFFATSCSVSHLNMHRGPAHPHSHSGFFPASLEYVYLLAPLLFSSLFQPPHRTWVTQSALMCKTSVVHFQLHRNIFLAFIVTVLFTSRSHDVRTLWNSSFCHIFWPVRSFRIRRETQPFASLRVDYYNSLFIICIFKWFTITQHVHHSGIGFSVAFQWSWTIWCRNNSNKFCLVINRCFVVFS